MADTKISGLPASTTPLAGTEVLPIVQSGVTKQVSVANLTAGRDVSANIFSSAAGAVATPSITTTGDTNTGIWFPAADTIAASTAGTERMRIDSAGRVGIGLVAPSAVPGATLLLSKSITGGVVGVGVAVSATIASDVTVIGRGFSTEIGIQNATFTVPDLQHFIATQGTKGASATITNQYGFNASSTLTGATNNYGFYSNIASGTGRWNFYAAGTAANVFVGTTSIGGVVGAESLRVTPVASAVNYLNVQGAVTTAAPSITAAGSDTNIDITLTPKGTGNVRFGTYTAGILAQTGYITIKDAAGNTRNLLVG